MKLSRFIYRTSYCPALYNLIIPWDLSSWTTLIVVPKLLSFVRASENRINSSSAHTESGQNLHHADGQIFCLRLKSVFFFLFDSYACRCRPRGDLCSAVSAPMTSVKGLVLAHCRANGVRIRGTLTIRRCAIFAYV